MDEKHTTISPEQEDLQMTQRIIELETKIDKVHQRYKAGIITFTKHLSQTREWRMELNRLYADFIRRHKPEVDEHLKKGELSEEQVHTITGGAPIIAKLNETLEKDFDAKNASKKKKPKYGRAKQYKKTNG